MSLIRPGGKHLGMLSKLQPDSLPPSPDTYQTIHVIASATYAGMNQPANISPLRSKSCLLFGSENHVAKLLVHQCVKDCNAGHHV